MKLPDDINLPEGLRAPKREVDPAFAAKRAAVLLGQIKSAKDRGILTLKRLNDSLGELNHYLHNISVQMNRANANMLKLYPQPDGSARLAKHGSLKQLNEYSQIERAYAEVYDAMTFCETLCAELRQ